MFVTSDRPLHHVIDHGGMKIFTESQATFLEENSLIQTQQAALTSEPPVHISLCVQTPAPCSCIS